MSDKFAYKCKYVYCINLLHDDSFARGIPTACHYKVWKGVLKSLHSDIYSQVTVIVSFLSSKSQQRRGTVKNRNMTPLK